MGVGMTSVSVTVLLVAQSDPTVMGRVLAAEYALVTIADALSTTAATAWLLDHALAAVGAALRCAASTF
jgi:hypothetical protein